MRIRKTHDIPVVHELVKTPSGEESPGALAGVPPTAVLVGVAGDHTLRLGYDESIARYDNADASNCKILGGSRHCSSFGYCLFARIWEGSRRMGSGGGRRRSEKVGGVRGRHSVDSNIFP